MASIFKRGRDGGKRHAKYYIEYTDHTGIRRTKKGFTDKALTEQLAAKLENESMLRREGLVDATEEEAMLRKSAPLEEHLEAFQNSLSRSDNTAKHVQLSMSRIRRIVNEAGFETARDIDADSVEEVLREILDSGRIGHKTYNHYLSSMVQFCKWLAHGKRGILQKNPLSGSERLNTEIDVRHPRRALRPEEFAMLVESARSSGIEIQCYDGEQRARIYLLSYFTGLRRKELGSLTPRSFDLDGNPPTLRVEAACSKHRRKDTLPLHVELVTLLRGWLSELESDEPLFPHLGNRRTWYMVRCDLERVGIPYRTDEGIADFHAAGRHTHITELLRNGASLVEAKELARHCDVRMTMKYTHIGLDDQAKALNSLPTVHGSCQHIGSTAGVAVRREKSRDVAVDCENSGPSPADGGTSVVGCHASSPSGTAKAMPPNGFDSRRLH